MQTKGLLAVGASAVSEDRFAASKEADRDSVGRCANAVNRVRQPRKWIEQVTTVDGGYIGVETIEEEPTPQTARGAEDQESGVRRRRPWSRRPLRGFAKSMNPWGLDGSRKAK